MAKFFKAAMRDQSGATAIEYSLIAGGIAMAVIGAVTLAGGSLAAWFQGVADAL